MRVARVLIADDLPEIRERVTHILQSQFEIVGSAQNGEQAITLAATLKPDLIVLDISMPVMNGLQAATRLRESGNQVKLVFLSVHEDRDYIKAAFAVGAAGYVFKSRLASDLVPALRWVLHGRRFTSSFQPHAPASIGAQIA